MSKKTSNPYKSANSKNAVAVAKQAERNKLRNKKAFVISLISFITIVVITLTLAISLYVPELKEEIVNKYPSTVTDKAIIKNGSFQNVYNDKMLQYPYVATNWTFTNDTTKSLIGVIDTDENKWSRVKRNLEQYGIENISNPGTPTNEEDSRVLAIYNSDETKSSATISSSFSLSANNYMEVSVWVKTIDIRGANVYMGLKTSSSVSAEFVETLEFTNINTNNAWSKYTFIVEANTSSQSLWLEMGLNTSDATTTTGLVFFDVAVADNARKADYIQQVYDAKSENPQSVNTIAYSFTKTDKDAVVTPIDFEFNKNSTSPSQMSSISHAAYHDTVDENLPFYFYDENNNDLFISQLTVPTSVTSSQIYPSNSTNANYMQIKVLPTLIGPSINDAFSISFWVLTKGLQPSTSAGIYLTTKDSNGKVNSSIQFDSISSPTDNKDDKLGGWKQYTMLLKASDILNYNVSIEIYLGPKDFTSIPTYGSLLVTDIECNRISYDKYTTTSTGTTTKQVDVSSINTETVSGTNLLPNPSFNTPITNENPKNDVYQPNGWRLLTNIYDAQTDKPNIISGIKKLDDRDMTVSGPNGLYIASDGATALGYTSNDITLSANSYYVFSVYAYGNASVYLTSKAIPDSDVSIAMSNSQISAVGNYDYNGLTLTSPNGQYTQYVFIVSTGYTSLTVSFELWLGGKDGTLCSPNDYVVFDNVFASSLTEAEFTALHTKGNKQAFSRITEITKDEETEEETLVNVYVQSLYDNVKVVDLKASDKEPPADEDEEEEEEKKPEKDYEPFDWMILTSMILALVLLAAVVMFLARKFKLIGRNRNKPTNQYDPDKPQE